MKLYLLRHGIAVERGAPEFKDDGLRPLTSEGVKKMKKIAKGMKAVDLEFDFILSSPLIRAKQTAEIVTKALGLEKKLKIEKALSAEERPEAILEKIEQSYKNASSLLLVGHEPYLTQFISLLLSGDQKIRINLKKGGLCKLTLDKISAPPAATLNWLLTPGQLEKI
jgi:phosphohistidine phosphatase